MIPVMSRMWMPLSSYGRSALVTARTKTGALSITGYAPSIFVPRSAAPGVGALTISGYAPTAGVDTPVSAGVGAMSITGYSPTISYVPSWPAFNPYIYIVGDGDLLDYGSYPSGSSANNFTNLGGITFETTITKFGLDTIKFPGLSNSYCTTPGVGDLQGCMNANWSLIFWMYPLSRDNYNGSNQAQGVTSWMRRTNDGAGIDNGWRIYLDGSGYLKFAEYEAAGIRTTHDVGSSPIALNEWTFIEINFDYASGITANQKLRGFVNGTKVLEVNPDNTGFGGASQGPYMGTTWWTLSGAVDPYNGLLSQYVLWDGYWNTSDYTVPSEQYPIP